MADLTGTNNSDTLQGTANADLIMAGCGDDEIIGLGNGDTIDAGDGDDQLAYLSTDEAGVASIDMGAGNDFVWVSPTMARSVGSALGGTGDDTLSIEIHDIVDNHASLDMADFASFSGFELVWAFVNNSLLDVTGTDNAETIVIGVSPVAFGVDDDFSWQLTPSVIDGAGGNDHIAVGGQHSIFTVSGGTGNDTIEALNGPFGALGQSILNVDGGSGDDVLIGQTRDDTLTGGDGNDTLTGGSGADLFVFGPGWGNDSLTDFDIGTDRIDMSGTGLTFSDLTITQDLADTLIEDGSGNSIRLANVVASSISASDLNLNAGAISGTGGNDTLVGTANTDTINGQGGDDTIYATTGGDVIDGGAGTDLLDLMTALRDQLGGDVAVNAHIDGPATADGQEIVSSMASIEALRGGACNDTLWGAQNNDALDGGDGDDQLIGRAGDDILEGGLGNDTLTGGDGNDTLTGGSGADLFVFGPGWGNDSLIDFVDGTDQIDLSGSGLTFGDLTITQDLADTLIEDGSGNSIRLANVAASDITASDLNLPGGSGGDGIITGTSGNDTLVGTANTDTINGQGGDDTIYATTGGDIVIGGDGIDLLDLMTVLRDQLGGDVAVNAAIDGPVTAEGQEIISDMASIEILRGGAGNDTLWGAQNNDTLYGMDGHDYIEGRGGDDYLSGGDGRDYLSGGDGNDIIFGLSNFDTIDGGAGDDQIEVGGNDAWVLGGTGNDTIHAGTGDQRIEGEDGQDRIEASGGQNLIGGGGDNDTILGGTGADEIYGEEGDDVIEGREGDDRLEGGFGSDTYNFGAGWGNDTITGFLPHSDRIDLSYTGMTYEDVTITQVGRDVLIEDSNGNSILLKDSLAEHFTPGLLTLESAHIRGTNNNDTLVGTANADSMLGRDGHDSISGLEGNDTISGGAGNDTIEAGSGANVATGGNGNDIIRAWASSQDNNSFDGGEGNDSVWGACGDDTLIGGNGDDTLAGADGNNQVYGGEGDDVLKGVLGNDTMTGGAGADTFVYQDHYVYGSAWGNDVIADFTLGTDQIDMSGLGISFSDLTITQDDADALVSDGSGNSIRLLRTDASSITAGDLNLPPGYTDVTLQGTAAADSLAGGAGNDSITGGDGNDTLVGGAGNDVLEGGAGADMLSGGEGSDTASYAGSSAGVNVSLALNAPDANAGASQTGGGDSGAGSFTGIAGSGKPDPSVDTPPVSPSTAGFAVSPTDQAADQLAATGGDAEGDTFDSIENLVGSGFDDTLEGNTQDNRLTGSAGNDAFVFGPGWGSDTITDFTIGEDRLHFRDAIISSGSLTITDVSGGALVEDDLGNSILLSGIAAADLSTDSFSFDIANSHIADNRAFESIGSSGDRNIDGILMGYRYAEDEAGGHFTLTYSFPDEDSQFFGYTASELAGLTGLSDAAQGLFIAAFDMLEDYTNLRFLEVADVGETAGTLRAAWTSYPRSAYAWSNFPNYTSWPHQGDTWFSSVNYGESFANFNTVLLHEFGHALGLSHAFYSQNGFGTVESQYNGWDYTVMAYAISARYPGTSTADLYPTSFMSLDIRALQYLYGADFNATSGDDEYIFDLSERYYFSLWDSGGTDTIRVVGGDTSVDIDLRGGWANVGTTITYNNTYAEDYSVYLMEHMSIENLYGANGDDTLIGNNADNDIGGGNGDDSLSGMAGDDTLAGGGGSDNLQGGDGQDIITGGVGADTLYGGAGDDSVSGGAGGDTYGFSSGWGDDVIEDFEDGVDTIDLRGTGINGFSDLTLSTQGSDVLISDGAGNSILVKNTLLSALSDADFLFGDLPITGTEGGDSLVGTGLDEIIRGLGGNDTILASGGNDTIEGGSDNDRINAGEGADIIDGGTGNDIIDGDAGADTIDGGTGRDQLIGGDDTDLLQGGDGDDTLSGGAGNDQLVGGNDSDNIAGGMGADTLDGGEGFDNLAGDAGDDTITGGHGDDTVTGGAGNDLLSGGSNQDTFLFGGTWGNDTISDFTEGEDILDLRGGTVIFDDLMIVQDGADALISDGNGNSIRLQNVDAALLGPEDVLTPGYDDEPTGSIETARSVAVGEVYTGELEEVGDDDWIAVTLRAGGVYQIDLSGGGSGRGTLNDTYLYLYDSTGRQLAQNDDGGPGLDSRLVYTASVTGTHFISARAFSDGYTGTYEVTVSLIGFEDQLITGTLAADSLVGDEGDDTILGSGGNDTLVGLGGDDIIDGGDDEDILHGGAGRDTLSGGNGDDIVEGESGNDQLFGGNGDDIVSGGEYQDVLHGGCHDDSLMGGNDNDTLFGDQGQDILAGGNGDDRIDGGTGDDTLIGNSGADSFFFYPDWGNDTITDFEIGVDKISLAPLGGSFDDLTFTQQGSNTLITHTSGNTILLEGVTATDLTSDDFIFGVTVAEILGITDPWTALPDAGYQPTVEPFSSSVNVTSNLIIGADEVYFGQNIGAVLSSYSMDILINNGTIWGEQDRYFTGSAVAGGNWLNAYNNGLIVSLTEEGAANGVYFGSWGVLQNNGEIYAISSEGDAYAYRSYSSRSWSGGDSLHLNTGVMHAWSGTDSASGVRLHNGGDFNNDGEIIAEGYMQAYGLLGATQLNNTGSITATTSGEGSESIGVSGYNIYNSGFITADIAVMSSRLLENSGTITGDIHTNSSDSIIHNRGSIVGDIQLGSGNDYVNSSSGTIDGIVDGGIGDDTIIGGTSNDIIQGGQGSDILTGGDGNDSLFGGTEGDQFVLTEGWGNDTIGDFDPEEDILSIFAIDQTFDDLTITQSGANTLIEDGLGNSVTLLNVNASDLNSTNVVNASFIEGTDESDTLSGDAFSNIIWGYEGEDILSGGAGDDTLVGGIRADVLHGDAGSDTASYADAHFGVNVSLATGTGTFGEATDDTLTGIENLLGSANNDTLTGDSGANRLSGGGSRDYLAGAGGDDTLIGGDGDDVFVMAAGWGSDTITDFVSGTDIIDMSATGLSWGDLTITQVGANTEVSDGSGNTIILEGITATDVTASDFSFDGTIPATNEDHSSNVTVADVLGITNPWAPLPDVGERPNVAPTTTTQNFYTYTTNPDYLPFYVTAQNGFHGGPSDTTVTNNAVVWVEDLSYSWGTVGIHIHNGELVNNGTVVAIGGIDRAMGFHTASTGNIINHGVMAAISEQDNATGIYAGAYPYQDINTGTIYAWSGSSWAKGFDAYNGFNLINEGEVIVAGYSSAVGVTGRGGTVNNSGTIEVVASEGASSIGVYGYNYPTQVTNSGTISANVAVRGANLTLDNSGSLLGDVVAFGTSTVVNTGIIDGNVTLGDGNDSLNSTGGNIDGTIDGGEGNDTIIGSESHDSILGGDGNDVLVGGNGDDTLTGGTGADVFAMASGGSIDVVTDFEDGIDRINLAGSGQLTFELDISQDGDNTILTATDGSQLILVGVDASDIDASDFIISGDNVYLGTSGNDVIRTDANNDTLYGFDGDDKLTANGGDDVLVGGGGDDTLSGGNGDNLYAGGDGADVFDLSNSIGTDTITDLGQDDVIRVTDGYDYQLQQSGADVIVSFDGSQRTLVASNANADDVLDILQVSGSGRNINGNRSDETINGTFGDDRIDGNRGDDLIRGGAGDDTLFGSDDTDTLEGGAGNDRIYTGSGNDIASGGLGDDTLVGDNAAVTLSGDDGNDLVEGSNQADLLFGGNGDDSLWGYRGSDTIDGGDGTDIAYFDGESQAVSIDLSTGTATTATGQVVLHNIENASGTNEGDDTLVGSDGANYLGGQSGNDSILGGGGDDRLSGGSGNDTLEGEAGNDTLTGGAGGDSYRFRENWGTDTIRDYQAGVDTIDLSNTLLTSDDVVFADVSGGALMSDSSGNSILFTGVAVTDIDLDDFRFTRIINGSNGDDSLVGDGQNNDMWGGCGDDLMSAGAGADSVVGGEGNDTLDGGTGNDTLEGGSGADLLIGGDGADLVMGGCGDDTVQAIFVEPDAGGAAMRLAAMMEGAGRAAADIMLDDTGAAQVTVSGDGLTYTYEGGRHREGLAVTEEIDSGQHYWEITLSDVPRGGGHLYVAIAAPADSDWTEDLGSIDGSLMLRGNGQTSVGDGRRARGGERGLDGVGEGDVIGVAFDADSGAIWISINGEWQNGATAAEIAAGDTSHAVMTGISEPYVATAGGYSTSSRAGHTATFAFDADSFTYAAPEGYSAYGGGANVVGDAGDTLDGGDGIDWIDLSNAPEGILMGEGRLEATGDSTIAGDVYRNFENIRGSACGDQLNGGDGDNVILGDGGDDTLSGGNGDDTVMGGDGDDVILGVDAGDVVDGGAGHDVISYANLSDGQAIVVSASHQNIEAYEGSSGDDTITGSNGDDSLMGAGGDDVIDGGNGDDTLDGGDGFDTLVGSACADAIDLESGTTNGGMGTDVISGFEAVHGGSGDDTITGDDGANVLMGEGGDDRLAGGCGDDTLVGGSGSDTFVFEADFVSDLIGDFTSGDDVIDLSRMPVTFSSLVITQSGSDTIVDVPDHGEITLVGVTASELTADDFYFGETTLDGTAGDDKLEGLFRDETISGFAGDDTLSGGDGLDLLLGGAGNDLLDGGAGADTIMGGCGDDTVMAFGDAAGSDKALEDASHADQVTVSGDLTYTYEGGRDREGVALSEDIDSGQYYWEITLSDVPRGGGHLYVAIAAPADSDWTEDLGSIDGSLMLRGNGQTSEGDGSRARGGVRGLDSIGEGDVIGVAFDADAGAIWISINGEWQNGATAAEIAAGDTSHAVMTGIDEPYVPTAGGYSTSNRAGHTATFSVDADSFSYGAPDGFSAYASAGAPEGGFDTVDGGDGIDVIDFTSLTSGVDMTGVSLSDAGGALIGADLYRNFENIIGSCHDDLLSGGDGDNDLSGGCGDDTLIGGSGDDTLTGGAGADLFRLTASFGTAVITDFTSGTDKVDLQGSGYDYWDIVDGLTDVGGIATFDDGNGNILTFAGIAAGTITVDDFLFGGSILLGTSSADTLEGTSEADYMIGLAGDDSLVGDAGDDTLLGSSGDDTLDGGDGFDHVSLTDGDDRVNLETGVAEMAAGEGTDTLIDIEAAHGGCGDDTLIGSDADEQLTGDAGDDVIMGASGDDTLAGGSGADSFVFGDGWGSDVITDFTPGSDILDFSVSSLSFGELTISDVDGDAVIEDASGNSITLSGVSAASVSESDFSFGDTITGTAGDDSLVGSLGRDSIVGLAGDDTILGGDSFDTLLGGDGNDLIEGGAGADLISAGAGDDTIGAYGLEEASTGTGLEDASHASQVTVTDDGLSYIYEGGRNREGVAASDEMASGQHYWEITLTDVARGGGGLYVAIAAPAGSDWTEDLGSIDGSLMLRGNGQTYVGDGRRASRDERGLDRIGEGDVIGVAFDADAGAIWISINGEWQNGATAAEIAAGDTSHAVMTGISEPYVPTAGGYDTSGRGGHAATFSFSAEDFTYAAPTGFSPYGGTPMGGDTVDGGDGFDVIDLTDMLTGVDMTGISLSDAGGVMIGDDLYQNVEGVIGSCHDDLLNGGDGNNRLDGGAGDDTIIGGAGDDTLSGGAGTDLFSFTSGFGSDVITDFDTAGDQLDLRGAGFNFAQVLAGLTQDGADAVFDAGGGNILRLTGVTASDVSVANFATLGTVRLGSAASDTITGDNGDDYAIGLLGNDMIATGGGSDTLDGGAGNDTLEAGAGDDTLTGGLGHDELIGGSGSDRFIMREGEGGDTITDFDIDEDILDLSATGITADILLQYAEETTSGGVPGVLIVEDWGGTLFIEGLSLGDLMDATILYSGESEVTLPLEGNNRLRGSNRSDVVTGTDGDDVIDARRGDDTVDGGLGDDTLTGNRHDDRFVFGADSGNDVITDLELGGDTLDFSGTAAGFATLSDVLDAAYATSHGRDDGVLIDLGGGNSVFLEDVSLAELTQATIIGDGGALLDVAASDDTFRGTSGTDIFTFTGDHGNDVITGFDPLADTLDLTGITSPIDSITLAARETNLGRDQGVLIDTGGGNTIFITGVSIGEIALADVDI